MERNVMGELNMHRAAGTKPNFSDIARKHGLDRHTVARYWAAGEEVEDRRSGRESAFERVRLFMPFAALEGHEGIIAKVEEETGLAGETNLKRIGPTY